MIYVATLIYVVTIINRKTRAILAFDVVTEHTWDTMQPLVDTVFSLKDAVFSLVEPVHQFYSDGFSIYHELVYRQGKRCRTSRCRTSRCRT